jgi:hypothetical protein
MADADRVEELKAEMETHLKLAADEMGVDSAKAKHECDANQTSFDLRIGRTLEHNLPDNGEFTVIETRKDDVRFASTKLRKLTKQLSRRTLQQTTRKQYRRSSSD